MTDEARTARLKTLDALLAHNTGDAEWTTPAASGGGSGDCVQALHVPEKGGWLVRNSHMPDRVLAFTDSEYNAFAKSVAAGQPGLAPDNL